MGVIIVCEKEKTIKNETAEPVKNNNPKYPTDYSNDKVNSLSQSECEHLTYLRTLEMYENLKEKRRAFKRYGPVFILCSAVFFLFLMFTFDSRIQFLCLWIFTTFMCVFFMAKSDWNCYVFEKLLGKRSEYNESDEFEDMDSKEYTEVDASDIISDIKTEKILEPPNFKTEPNEKSVDLKTPDCKKTESNIINAKDDKNETNRTDKEDIQ